MIIFDGFGFEIGGIKMAEIQQFKDRFEKIESEVSNVIIGQKDIIRNVLIGVIAGGNVLLEGLPGLGKTQLVKAVGEVLELNFSRIQFTPDLMPSDITGTDIFVKNEDGSSNFKFQQGPVFSNIVLADEINRATPKTQSALLEAMQEKTVTVGRTTYKLPEPFFVLATQNPLEQDGTYPLPEAQMDRFLFKLNVDFPNHEELCRIMEITTGLKVPEPKKVYSSKEIQEMKQQAKEVPIAKAVMDYAVRLVLNTHSELETSPEIVKKYVRYGASPRGAQAIITASRINALIEGRYNVAFEDIKKVAYPALRHRIFMNFDAVSDNITPDTIIGELLKEE